MRSALLGVMGHVDHGKTSLVGALTGMETDRLEEEIRRGLSITLGFAHLRHGGATLSFVDMPGHERFVRTMIAGACGLDAALLCVAADEGVMPQTREHVDVAALLGVRRAVVAVTRADRAPERVEAVQAEACGLLTEAGIGCAGVVATSVRSGRGLAALADVLAALAGEGAAEDAGWCALSCDRVFSLRGHGLVATGTLRHGPVAVGDALAVAPDAPTVRVRALHVHGQPVDRAPAGGRVALNLRGEGCAGLERGAVLVTPGLLRGSNWFDVALRLVPSAPRPVDGARPLRLLCGTREVGVRVRLLEREALRPGESALAQLRTDAPLAVAAGERFILREASPPVTIGGGTVLDPLSRRRRRTVEAVASLEALRHGDALAAALEAAGPAGRPAADVGALAALGPAPLAARLTVLGAVRLGERVLSARAAATVRQGVTEAIAAFHRRHPTVAGLPPHHLRGLVPEVPGQVLDAMVVVLQREGVLKACGGGVRRADIDPGSLLNGRDRDLVRSVEAQVRDGGLTPPDVAHVVAGRRGRQQALRFLVRTGVLVRTVDQVQKREVIFHATAIAEAARRLGEALGNREFTAGEAGRVLATTRKYTIPLLEHLDGRGFTRRDGDLRRIVPLRTKEAAHFRR